METAVKLESIIKRFGEILTSNHQIMLDLKQNLITMYENSKLSEETFKRKLELCNELVRVLKLIEPEISRLTGKFLSFPLSLLVITFIYNIINQYLYNGIVFSYYFA